jgi:hypothetical protein
MIVLTWTSSPGVSYFENELPDLDMGIVTDSWTGYGSYTWDSNVEIIDVPNEDLTPNSVYPLYVYPKFWRQAEDGPGISYYTVAWTWVKDHAD